MKIRVYYEDTDVGGVVYHSNYLNFCERARSELFFSKGLSPILKQGQFVAASLKADFKRPAKFADVLEVKTELVAIKKASFTLKQRVFREETLLFVMEISLAYVSHEGKLQRFDTEVEALLREIIV